MLSRSAAVGVHQRAIVFENNQSEERRVSRQQQSPSAQRLGSAQRGGRTSGGAPAPSGPVPGGGGRPTNVRRTKPAPEEPVRLAKALADAGVASRRAAELLITAGRIRVNGKTVDSPALNVTPGKDVLEFDGKKVVPPAAGKKYYLVLHKPRGYLCSNEQGGEKLVLDLFQDWIERFKERNPERGNFPPRLFTVGRLDVGTSGLIFVTNDGAWCQKISHPSSQVTKEYVLRAETHVTRRQVESILAGCEVDGVHVKPIRCEPIANVDGGGKNRILVEVMDGRNREVRRLAENAGIDVASLKRTRIGSYKLPYGLKAGQYLELAPKDAMAVLAPL